MLQPQHHVSIRRKVTMACQVCRKRRIKCSGVVPCQYCVANKRQCWIDKSGRGRRGPRPQARGSDKLATKTPPPPLGSPVISPSSVALVANGSTHVEPIRDGDGDGDESESGDEPDTPSVPLCQSDIERVLFEGKSISNPSDKTYLGLVCHLLELHCRRTSVFLARVLSTEEFVRVLNAGVCPRHLIFAICACNVRFSVHILTRPSHGSNLASYFEQQARHGLDSSLVNGFGIADIYTYCFLVECAINSGCGGRAWPDIALAESLIQLKSAGQAPDTDAQHRQGLTAASQYLAVARAIMCIGNPDLQSMQQQTVHSSLPTRMPGTPALKRLWILLRIQGLCAKPFAQHEPLPWDESSEFRCVQEELDGYLIRWPEAFATEPSTDNTSDACPNDAETSVALLVSHCSIILLNRTFLPIHSKTTGRSGVETYVHWVSFPSAPDLFIKERISRCEASVAAICLICKDMIAKGEIFAQSFWIGFSCVLSALVVINRLHASSTPRHKLVESLKFTLAVIVSLRQFLKPANDWADMLFRIYDAATCSTQEDSPAENSFLTYFSRYPGIQDVIRVPLFWKSSPISSPWQKGTTPRGPTRLETSMMQRETTCQEASWIAVYTEQLDQQEPANANDAAESAETPTACTPVQPVPNDGSSVNISEMLDLIFDNNGAPAPGLSRTPTATGVWPGPPIDLNMDLQSIQSLLSEFPTDWLGLEESIGLEGGLDVSVPAIDNDGLWPEPFIE